MIKDFRKSQMKLAVLLEVSKTTTKNSAIIKGAEGRLLLDDAYNRLMQNGKQTIGSKQLQFLLYNFKCDSIVDVPKRGVYNESEATVNARIALAFDIVKFIDGKQTNNGAVILNEDTLKTVRKLVQDNRDWKQQHEGASKSNGKIARGKKTNASPQQVGKSEKQPKEVKVTGNLIVSKGDKGKENEALPQQVAKSKIQAEDAEGVESEIVIFKGSNEKENKTLPQQVAKPKVQAKNAEELKSAKFIFKGNKGK